MDNGKHSFKNCPFCGKDAGWVKVRSSVLERRMGNNSPCSALTKVWAECTYCGASGPTRTIDAVYPEELEAAAIAAWNRRDGKEVA